MLSNPILTGFHADPSIVRVGEDYYIATSTFEWFPGVMIYHSRDLIHWRPVACPLTRTSQLEMLGVCSSGGVWAPCLSHDGKQFYLVYTNVTNRQIFYDTHNYVVTAPAIEGPWSEPIYLNSAGFDPSLFHDEDGRKWYLSMISDPRKGRNKFGGIILQEYDAKQARLIGTIHKIYQTEGELVEGGHLYHHDGWYYMLLAYGGTGPGHGALMLRARSLTGPYERDPMGLWLTSRFQPFHPLQRAGHADLVQTQNGQWYAVHLCARPIPVKGRSTLGRETALQQVLWQDGWLRLAHGGNLPAVQLPAPNLPPHPFAPIPARAPWDSLIYQSLRRPLGQDQRSLSVRPGWLRLYGMDGPTSKYTHTLLARRQQHLICTAITHMDFTPTHYKHFAGLICIYDHENWYYLRKTCDESGRMLLGVMQMVNGQYDESGDIEVPSGSLHLKATIRYDKLHFFYTADPEGAHNWQQVGGEFDASTLSDEHCREGAFTGCFIGVAATDMLSRIQHADFEWLEYVGEDHQHNVQT